MKLKPIVELRHITKIYGSGKKVKTKVLNGVFLKVFAGDFIAITGPSGSGKSTLMNVIGLLDTSTSGQYLLNGIDITRLLEDKLSLLRNKEIGFIFQSFNLLGGLSVLENVTLPAIYAGTPSDKRETKAKDLLKKLGLEEKVSSLPNELSGGQQQKVAIARALINDPKLILADEPTGNLDTKSGEDVMKILEDLNKQGTTIILITHERNIARKAKKIIRIRDGRII